MSKFFYGIGFNSGGKHKAGFEGKHATEYNTWRNMLRRCYSDDYQSKQPTYIGCVVDKRWYDYQDFAEWYDSHEYSDMGYELDKDLLIPDNKIYSPETCCFVPRSLNKLLNNRKAICIDLPVGVSLFKERAKYMATINIDGKSKYLGLFDSPNEAHQVYKKAKEAYVKEKALEWRYRIADDVFEALMNWKLAG